MTYTRTERRSSLPDLAPLRQAVLMTGTLKDMLPGMFVDPAKCLAGAKGMKRTDVELVDGEWPWRQCFVCGGIMIEFFFKDRPRSRRYRGDYYRQLPDHVIVSRMQALGVSDETFRTEEQVLECMQTMLNPSTV